MGCWILCVIVLDLGACYCVDAGFESCLPHLLVFAVLVVSARHTPILPFEKRTDGWTDLWSRLKEEVMLSPEFFIG